MVETVLLTGLLLAGLLAVLAQDHRVRRDEIQEVRRLLRDGLGDAAFTNDAAFMNIDEGKRATGEAIPLQPRQR